MTEHEQSPPSDHATIETQPAASDSDARQDADGRADSTTHSHPAATTTPEAAPTGTGAPEAAPEPNQTAAPAAAAESTPESEQAAPSEESKKPKRRRRNKKKAQATAGEGGATAEAQKGENKASVPLMRYFELAERNHAFSPGEVVAGRVVKNDEGAVVVDLFGKALASADEYEPREIEPLPEPPPPEPKAEAQASQPTEPTSEPVSAPNDQDAQIAHDAQDSTDAPTTEVAAAPEPTAAMSDADHPPSNSVEASAAAAMTHETDMPPAEMEDEGDTQHTPETQPAEEPAGPPPDLPEVGEVYRGRVASVARSGHIGIVNRAVDKQSARAALKQAAEERRRVKGVVFGFNPGGFDVLVAGLRVFCPASAMSLRADTDPNTFIGKKFEFTVPANRTGSMIVSRRSLLERELRKARKLRLKSIEPGQELEGTVSQVKDFGLFVDLGDGVEGLVHQSEATWTRGTRMRDLASEGQVVQVKVLAITPPEGKSKHAKISLSMKQRQADPWDEHQAQLQPATVTRGTVMRTTDFGAFVQVAPGVEGLLHIEELGKGLRHANQAVQEGDSLDVVIERVDKKQRRLSLSKLNEEDKALLEGGSTVLPKPGNTVDAVVKRVEHRNILLQIPGVPGRRGRGTLQKRDLGNQLTGAKIEPGQTINVKIVGFEKDGTVKCSVRAKEVDEERQAVRDYKKEAAKQGLGTFGDLLKAKLNQ